MGDVPKLQCIPSQVNVAEWDLGHQAQVLCPPKYRIAGNFRMVQIFAYFEHMQVV